MKEVSQDSAKFSSRHIGPRAEELTHMLHSVGVGSLDQLIEETVPQSIRLSKKMELGHGLSEAEYIKTLRAKAAKNKVFDSFIGLGYSNTITPAVIKRNIFENPGWYTQYTPYQAEISQGRLEALLNFQTMIMDLTGMDIANASLLDEGTAAAEAMALFHRVRSGKKVKAGADSIFVSDKILPQTLDILKTRAEPMDIKLVVGDYNTFDFSEPFFGAILQYPDAEGKVHDYRVFTERAKEAGIKTAFAADLLSLTVLTPPGEFGADVVLGNTQRFGVPMGFGGPHAAYFAARDADKRQVPGRIIGVSMDSGGKPALRMALQTREQHIRREKATSNICTAQALLAIMAGAYAVYHGPQGLKRIAQALHRKTVWLAAEISHLGFQQTNEYFFDTLKIKGDKAQQAKIQATALAAGVNFRYYDSGDVGIALDETVTGESLLNVLGIFATVAGKPAASAVPDFHLDFTTTSLPADLVRTSPILEHAVFNKHHSETAMMRYLKTLENRDLALNRAMIPLGSCTMKLNAATEMEPVSWPEFASMHPFAPVDQTAGYLEIIKELEHDLSVITGFAATSLQPNSGAQGEYAGLLVIRAFHKSQGQDHRNTVLIPISAHGTNPASAVMAGMKVVLVKCDDQGNIDLPDLRKHAAAHKDDLSSLMITYPSTHGVFEEDIIEICEIIHDHGGQVYMDGANMNAQVGLTSPGYIGADVCHLNLHKTFAIPHGGGGPGIGPICVAKHLAPFLPGHPLDKSVGGENAISAISAAGYGSALVLLISYGYIKMMGGDGLLDATKMAILNANYIKSRLEKDYDILFTGKNGRVAHEMILDIRPFKKDANIDIDDAAKRLIDYGFHAPTMSWPIAGTLMVEPTESEPLEELDRFCEAMLSIRREIQEIAEGGDANDNVLKNAPHTAVAAMGGDWNHSYSREKAVFPVESLKSIKYWPEVGRVDNVYGDRNLVCACPPLEAYAEEESELEPATV